MNDVMMNAPWWRGRDQEHRNMPREQSEKLENNKHNTITLILQTDEFCLHAHSVRICWPRICYCGLLRPPALPSSALFVCSCVCARMSNTNLRQYARQILVNWRYEDLLKRHVLSVLHLLYISVLLILLSRFAWLFSPWLDLRTLERDDICSTVVGDGGGVRRLAKIFPRNFFSPLLLPAIQVSFDSILLHRYEQHNGHNWKLIRKRLGKNKVVVYSRSFVVWRWRSKDIKSVLLSIDSQNRDQYSLV